MTGMLVSLDRTKLPKTTEFPCSDTKTHTIKKCSNYDQMMMGSVYYAKQINT